MVVLVTGASGFIGTELVKELIKTHQVIGLDLKPATVESPNYRHCICDCANPVEFFKTVAKFDVDIIFHFAATVGVANFTGRNSTSSFLNNTNIDRNMMMYLQRHPDIRVYFASSSEVYGECSEASEDSDVSFKISPRAAYAVEKLMFETFLRTRQNSVILRLFNIIGPTQDPAKGVVAKFYNRIKTGHLITIFNQCIRSFCDVRDAVGEILAITEPGTYNIGSDLIRLTIREMAEQMLEFFGIDAEIIEASPRTSEIVVRSPDLTKISKLYKPRYRFEDTLKTFPKI